MKKIIKSLLWDRRIIILPATIFVFIMALTIFSQAAMEIYAYNFFITNSMESEAKTYVRKTSFHNISEQNNEKSKKQITERKRKSSGNKANTKIEKNYFILPVSGGVNTSYFGDTIGRSASHKGHDWAVPAGTVVMASADGQVELAYYSNSYGYNVLIRHNNGMETRYAHLSSLSVEKGQFVKQSQIIGFSGSTGDSTGPHLHFEIIKNNVKVNPLNYLLR